MDKPWLELPTEDESALVVAVVMKSISVVAGGRRSRGRGLILLRSGADPVDEGGEGDRPLGE